MLSHVAKQPTSCNVNVDIVPYTTQAYIRYRWNRIELLCKMAVKDVYFLLGIFWAEILKENCLWIVQERW